MAAFAADTAFDQTVALGATLGSQGNFSLRAGADDHFNSFLEQFRLGPGSNERGKLAEGPFNLKRLATTLPGRHNTTHFAIPSCNPKRQRGRDSLNCESFAPSTLADASGYKVRRADEP